MDNDRKQQNLTDRQLKAIPLLLSGRTISEGCRKANISRECFYEWMKDENFKAEFQRQRMAIMDDFFHSLKLCGSEAVEVLKDLLKAKNEGVRLRTAVAVIENISKAIEREEILRRIEEIERRFKK